MGVKKNPSNAYLTVYDFTLEVSEISTLLYIWAGNAILFTALHTS